MATYFMFGTYSAEALKEASKERTEKARQIVKQAGGELRAMYALLGEQDLVFIATFPTVETAMQASLMLTTATGISFSTSPALPVDEFDKLLAD